MKKTVWLIIAGFVILAPARAQQPTSNPPAAARFRAFAMPVKPLLLTPRSPKLLVAEAVTGGVAMTAAKMHTGRWDFNPIALLTIHNGEQAQSVKEIELSFTIYDKTKRQQVGRLLRSKQVTVKPNRSADVELTVISKLPADNLVLLQLTKVVFGDGSIWSAPDEYTLSDDLQTIGRQAKPTSQ